VVTAASAPASDLYHGTVVDAETGTPLRDAAVVILWKKRPLVAMDGGEYFHEVHEAVTDADGRFAIPASRGVDWNPLTYVKPVPEIVVYAVGHAPLAASTAVARGFESSADVDAALRRGTTIRLPMLTAAEKGKFTSLGILSIGRETPHSGIANLLRLIDRQRELEKSAPRMEPVRD